MTLWKFCLQILIQVIVPESVVLEFQLWGWRDVGSTESFDLVLQIRHIDRLILWSISGNGMPSMAPRDLAASCKEWGFIAFIDLMDILYFHTFDKNVCRDSSHLALATFPEYRHIEVVVVMSEIPTYSVCGELTKNLTPKKLYFIWLLLVWARRV